MFFITHSWLSEDSHQFRPLQLSLKFSKVLLFLHIHLPDLVSLSSFLEFNSFLLFRQPILRHPQLAHISYHRAFSSSAVTSSTPTIQGYKPPNSSFLLFPPPSPLMCFSPPTHDHAHDPPPRPRSSHKQSKNRERAYSPRREGRRRHRQHDIVWSGRGGPDGWRGRATGAAINAGMVGGAVGGTHQL